MQSSMSQNITWNQIVWLSYAVSYACIMGFIGLLGNGGQQQQNLFLEADAANGKMIKRLKNLVQ